MPILGIISLDAWLLVSCILLMQSWSASSLEQCTSPFTKSPMIVQRNPYAFIGETLSLNCYIEFNTSLSSNVSETSLLFQSTLSGKCEVIPHSYFEKNDSHAEIAISHLIDESQLSVRTKFLSYRCTSNLQSCSSKQRVGSCAVRIDETNSLFIPIEYRPLPVYNISCVVYDWEGMTCRWDLRTVYINGEIDTDINVMYRNSSRIHPDRDEDSIIAAPLSPCRMKEMKGSMLTCTFIGNRGSDGYHPGIYYFQINITNNKRLVSAVTNMTINTLHFVRPAKVNGLSVKMTSTMAIVTWTRTKSQYRAQCLVRYSSIWNDDKEEITLEAKITLKNLIPNTEYTINVTCIPVDVNNKTRGYWSEPSQIIASTSEDAPGSVPVVMPNFYHCLQEECSTARIFFQPITKKVRHGRISEYRITVSNKHYKVSGMVTSAVVPLNKGFSNISITQATSKGYPNVPASTFTIPPNHLRPPLPSDVVAVALNASCVKVSWDPVEFTRQDRRLLSYTVLWCIDDGTGSCRDVIQYRRVSPTLNENLVTFTNGNVTDYQFGVASEVKMNRVTVGSGIQWNGCTYNQSEETDARLSLEIVMLETKTNSMTVRWEPYSCQTTRAYLLNYVLYYCSASSICTAEDISIVTVNRRMSNYSIQNLPPGKYKSWIQGNFSSGRGPNSTDVDFVIYQQNDENIVLWWVSLLCVTVVALVVLLIYFIRRLCMTWNNNLPIDVPSIDKSKIDRNKEYSSCPSSSENSEKPLIPTNQRFPTTEKSYMLTDVTYHKEFEKPYTESYSPEKVYPEYYSPQKVYPEHYSPQIVYPEHYSPQIVYPEHYIPVNMLDSVMEGNESQDEDCYSVKDIEAGLKEESVPIENIYKDIDGGHNQTVPKACTEYIDSYIQL